MSVKGGVLVTRWVESDGFLFIWFKKWFFRSRALGKRMIFLVWD